MKKIISVILLTLLFVGNVSAQQTNNWYFGSAAGFANTGIRIDWANPASPVVSTCIPMLTEEGTSSMSSSTGASLFYTDGVTVYDGVTNTVLPGGTGLLGGSSSTQSAIIMPKPGSTTQWLLFTSGPVGTNGVNYYTVTGTTPTGPFSVSAGINLVPAATVGEGLFIIGSTKPGSSFWVIARDTDNALGGVRAWDVTTAGVVNATEVTSNLSGTAFINTDYSGSKIGTIKSNTCQTKLAFTYLNGAVDITDFNATTGQVTATTARRINVTSTGGNSGSYGIEFSSNDAYLYITNLSSGNIYKYDVVANTVASLANLTASAEAGQLQTAPDGNIYMARRNLVPATGATYLSRINNPNTVGATFTEFALLTNAGTCAGNAGFTYRGLPTFPKSLVVNNPIISPASGTYCVNTAIALSFTFAGSINGSGVTWTQTGTGGTFTPGGATSTSLSPSITFTTTGAKTVTVSFNDACGRPYTATRNFTITTPSTPVGTVSCSGNNLVLDNPAVDPNEPQYIWYKNSISAANIIGIGTPVNYAVGSNSALPTQICLSQGSTATQTSGSNSIASSLTLPGAANGSPYVSNDINVLADNLVLKSFDIKFWVCPGASVGVNIKDGGGTSVFNQSIPITCVAGSIITVPINTTLLKGNNYTITLTGGQYYRNSWSAVTNAGEITYGPESSAGTTSIANIQYDYKNFNVVTSCVTTQCYVVGCTLPLAWLSTSAQRENDHVVVAWSVASQINNQRFEIQRSLDGIHFETVGIVPGAGTNKSYSAYDFLDFTNEKGKLYYRIVQYDFDGLSSNSGIVSVEPLKLMHEFALYPNPTNGQFTLTLLSSEQESGQMVIRVYNSIGQEVYGAALQATILSTGLTVDLSSLSQGAYLVKVTTNKGEWIEHLIKK